jgi:DNA-binding response OmpR family regulator
VLVVEDNLDTVHSLVTLLRQDGHEVDFAINGYVALEVAKRFRPDVVLLDLGLPGLDGYYVCSRLKSEPGLEDVRVIAVTAYVQDEYRIRSRAAGCDLHIGKPYDPRQLLAAVREV